MINPEKKTIENILKASVVYSIPSYQRNFDWGKSELQELIDDINETSKSKNSELFLGNFIMDISKKENHEIVDGQQRLTTFSIILIALRTQARKLKDFTFATELQQLITVGSSYRPGISGNKIKVSENIRDIFEYIAEESWDGKFPNEIGNKSVRRQKNKVKPIYDELCKEFLNYDLKAIKKFHLTLMDSYVIVVEVENTTDVFSIFERTNARGLDLNLGDLLKNYIFSKGLETYEGKWANIIENSQNSLQRMLKYFWTSRMGHAMQKDLYKNLRNYGRKRGIENFVDELYEFSRFYKAIIISDNDQVKLWLKEFGLKKLSNNQSHFEEITRYFQALKLFKVTQAYPLIFSVFRAYRQSDIEKPKELFKFLETIERYHFVNNKICNRIGNEVEKLYPSEAQSFFTLKKGFQIKINNFIQKLKNQRAPKGDFITNFNDVSYSSSAQDIQFIIYLFDRINNFGLKGGQIFPLFEPHLDVKQRNYNIEHILPQSRKKSYDEKESQIIDQLGNLLVIPRHTNSGLPPEPFDKIKLLKENPQKGGDLSHVRQFIKDYEKFSKNWDLNMITKRNKKMAENAYDVVWNF